jgi:hypothetical protein
MMREITVELIRRFAPQGVMKVFVLTDIVSVAAPARYQRPVRRGTARRVGQVMGADAKEMAP